MTSSRLHRCGLITLLGLALAAPVAAQDLDLGLDLVVGRAWQREGDRLVSLAGTLSLQPAGWWVQPELGYETKFFPLFAGEDQEITAGLRSEWPAGDTARIWLGGGYANLRMDWGANRDRSDGWYARAGAMWAVGRGGFSMGVEGKLTRAPDFEAWGSRFKAGSHRIGLLMGWRI